jgi:transcriptional regulator with GAF, ATPase, and Fis domain
VVKHQISHQVSLTNAVVSLTEGFEIEARLDSSFRDDFIVPYDGPERRSQQGGRRSTDLAPQQQAAIAAALLNFGDLVADEPEGIALLDLIDCCQLLVPSCECSVMVRELDGGLRILAASSEAVRSADDQQIQEGNGPSIESLSYGNSVLEVKFTEPEELWQWFLPLVLVHGFTRLYAIPLRSPTKVIGVLNVYARKEEGAPSAKLAWVRTLARAVALSLDNRRSLARQLQQALDSRVLIEQAKGVLATKLAVTIEVAFEFLRSYSRSHNRSIREVAAEVISNQLTAEELPPMARRPRRSPGSVHK